MLEHIKSIEALEIEAQTIQDYLETTCSDEPTEALERGSNINVYLARSGKMLADAKYWQDEAINNSIIQKLKDQLDLSPMIFKRFIDSSIKRENYLANWIDRINSTCTHQLDMLRTAISFYKNKK